jgi:predicted Zn-ribbon and HTH transcriptional regulator
MSIASAHEEHRALRGSLVCSACGYGIARETPPGPCPMCRADEAWVRSPRYPFAAADGIDGGWWERGSR